MGDLTLDNQTVLQTATTYSWSEERGLKRLPGSIFSRQTLLVCLEFLQCGNTTAVQFLRSLTVLDLTESRDYKHSPKSKKNKRRLLITSIFSLDVCVEETKIFT